MLIFLIATAQFLDYVALMDQRVYIYIYFKKTFNVFFFSVYDRHANRSDRVVATNAHTQKSIHHISTPLCATVLPLCATMH